MRRLLLTAVALVLLGITAVSAAWAARPTIRVVDSRPLMLQGTGFVPSERVKLLVSVARTRRIRVARAGQRGAFSVVVRGLAVGPCSSGLSVRAIGSRGSRAYFQLYRPDRMCPLRGERTRFGSR